MNSTIILDKSKEEISFLNSPTKHTDDLEILVKLPNIESSPCLHIHPLQSKKFEAIDGNLVIALVSDKIMLKPGESYIVKPNIIHTCIPESDVPTLFKITYTPSLNMQYLLTEMFDACNRNHSKHATIFEACYIMAQAPEEYYVANHPIWIQRFMFPIVAKIGKLLGRIAVKDIKTNY